jgi:hypothetical protein
MDQHQQFSKAKSTEVRDPTTRKHRTIHLVDFHTVPLLPPKATRTHRTPNSSPKTNILVRLSTIYSTVPISRTRRPLYLVLHFNYQPRDPHVIYCPLNYPQRTCPTPVAFLTSLSPTYPWRPCPSALRPTAALLWSSPCMAGRDSGEARRLAGGAEVDGVPMARWCSPWCGGGDWSSRPWR